MRKQYQSQACQTEPNSSGGPTAAGPDGGSCPKRSLQKSLKLSRPMNSVKVKRHGHGSLGQNPEQEKKHVSLEAKRQASFLDAHSMEEFFRERLRDRGLLI